MSENYDIYPRSTAEGNAVEAVLKQMKEAKAVKVFLWKAGDNGSMLGIFVTTAKQSKIGGGLEHAVLGIRFAEDNTRAENLALCAKFGITEDMIPTRKTNS